MRENNGENGKREKKNLKDGNKFNGIFHTPFFSLSNIFDFLFVSKEKEFFQLK